MTPRRLDAGALVAALGALVLLVGLFLDWYGDGDGDAVSAWTVFEALDLVLAAIALLAIATLARRAGAATWLPDGPLLVLGAVALAVVVSQIVNDPPRVAGLDPDLEVGAWLSLAGAAVLLAGGLMSAARVSLEVSVEHRDSRSAVQPAAEPETVKMTPPDPPA